MPIPMRMPMRMPKWMSKWNRVAAIARRASRTLAAQALALAALAATLPGLAGADQYLRLKVLAVVYTDTFAGSASYGDVENVRRELDEAVEFVWRSSRMRVHLAVDDRTIYRFLPEEEFGEVKPGRYVLPFWALPGAQNSVATDVAGLGFPDDSYDIVVAFYAFDEAPGRRNRFGAATYGLNRLLGKAAYVLIPMSWAPSSFNKYFEHEFLHVLKQIFDESGGPSIPLVHNGDLFHWLHGRDADYEKWLLGSVPAEAYLGIAGRWGTVEVFKDRDGDGVPDYSPYGDELSITEETLGSSTSSADSDGDGLSDLDEAVAGVRGGTDPNHPDTDGDGLVDGLDPDPLGGIETDAE